MNIISQQHISDFYICTNTDFDLLLWGGIIPPHIHKDFIHNQPITQLFPTLDIEYLREVFQTSNQYQTTLEIGTTILNLHINLVVIDTERLFFFSIGNTPEPQVIQANIFSIVQLILKGKEMEKARMTRELHDGLGQLVTALKIKLSIFERYRDVRSIDEDVTSMKGLLDLIQKELRGVLLNLNASCLELSLESSIEMLIDHFRENYHNVFFDFQIAVSSRAIIAKETELHLYRIIQEALNNSLKHSKADVIKVYLGDTDSKLVLFIDDNGRGFDKFKVFKGYGLKNIENRAKILNAEFYIETSEGKGASILLNIPPPQKFQIYD
jgi:signal transduction histidine kinase